MASIKKIEGKNGVSYKITVSCGYDVKGKKIIETATFKPDAGLTPKKMEKAAQDFAHEFESRVKSGAAMDGRKVTLQVFADRWIEEYAKPKLQPGTVRKYREELDDKILPAIGHYKLSEIKPHTVNAFFLSLTKDGARKDGKAGGYSKGSITKTRNVLSSILRTATEWEIIDRNPCDKVRVQAESTADKLKFFTPEQAAAFSGRSCAKQPTAITCAACPPARRRSCALLRSLSAVTAQVLTTQTSQGAPNGTTAKPAARNRSSIACVSYALTRQPSV